MSKVDGGNGSKEIYIHLLLMSFVDQEITGVVIDFTAGILKFFYVVGV
jgi:hypothetical protein